MPLIALPKVEMEQATTCCIAKDLEVHDDRLSPRTLRKRPEAFSCLPA